MNKDPESPCPELVCDTTELLVVVAPLPYTNDAVSSGNLCPPGVTPISSAALPGWISFDGTQFDGAAGIYRGADKAAANSLAQAALDSFVQAAFLNGTLVCDCPTILTAIMPPTQWLPAPGLEILNFHTAYGIGPNGGGSNWKPGSYPPTSLIGAAWPVLSPGGGLTDPIWDGVFPTYPVLSASNANPLTGNIYAWRTDLHFPVLCRVGRVMSVPGFPSLFYTEQAYAKPSTGGQPDGMFLFTARCASGQLVWLVQINSEYSGFPSGEAGSWYKLGGYTPEGTYKLTTGNSPPHTAYADFGEFGTASTTMHPFAQHWDDQAPVIGVFAQINMVCLPNQEYSDSSHAKVLSPPGIFADPFAYKFNFVRYLNTDVHGLNGTFYMTRDGSNDVYASADGYTWSVVSTIANAAGLTDIAYGNGKFVVTSKHRLTGQATIYFSTNAIAWTEVDLPLTQNNGDLNAVVFGIASGGVFLACQTNQNSSGTSFWSSDGMTWVPVTTLSPSTQPRFCNNRFLIVSKFGEVASSSDCVTWTAHSNLPQNQVGYDIAFGGFQYVVGGNDFFYTSQDLAEWDTVTFAFGAKFVSIAFGVFMFVAVTDRGIVFRSSDGINWVPIMYYGQMKWTGEDSGTSFEQTTGTFVIPAVNATVPVNVFDTNRMSLAPGRSVWIGDGTHEGLFTVVSRTSATQVLLRFLQNLTNCAPGITMATLAHVYPFPGNSIYVRGSGQFFGKVFVGASHDIVAAHGFSGGTLLSVTYYSDTNLFIGAASLTIGTPSQGVARPDANIVYFYSPDGVNWGHMSPAAPQGPLKSVCFHQGGTFIAV